MKIREISIEIISNEGVIVRAVNLNLSTPPSVPSHVGQ